MTRDELLALGLNDEQAGAVQAAFDAQAAAREQTEVENAQLRAQIELRDKRDAVLFALPAYKPKDAQIVLRLIDLEQVSIEGGEISGLDEQVKTLQTAAPYLFTELPDPVGGTAAPGVHPEHFDMNTFLRGEN